MRLEQQIIDQIRETSLQTEQTGKLAPEALSIIIERGWFKLFVPESYGGAMASLPEALKVFEYAAWVDGSFGWLTTIGAGGGYFVAFMQPETAANVFTPVEAVIAGSGMPTGTAIPTDGGYIVNGSWGYCSGSEHATTFTANCIIQNDNGNEAEPEICAFAFTPDQVEIVKDWQAFGLKATDSHTIRVKNQFVKRERTFSLLEQTACHNEPLFSYPFLPFAQATFCAISIGIAKHLLEEAQQLAAQKQAAWRVDRYTFVAELIAQAELDLHHASLNFQQIIEQSWSNHLDQRAFTEDEVADISNCCLQTSRIALSCGQKLLPYMGMSAIMEHEPINQIWRDLQTACQHSLLVPFAK